MKLRRQYRYSRFGVFVMVPVYLVIAATHLFFSPDFRANENPVHKVVFTNDTQFVYFLIRNDRSTSLESKNFKTFAKTKPGSHGYTLTGHILPTPTIDGSFEVFSSITSHHHRSFLQNCVMRI